MSEPIMIRRKLDEKVEPQCTCKEEMRKAYHEAGNVPQKPRRCPVDPRDVHTQCVKCGEVIIIRFDAGMSKARAEQIVREMDYPRECPGYHVELSGWDRWWQLRACIKARFETKSEILKQAAENLGIEVIVVDPATDD